MSVAWRDLLWRLLHDHFEWLQVTNMLKDVFVEGTHLSMCLNVSPASKDFCDETLQLLEQMSLPQKLGSAGTQRCVTLQVPDTLRLA